MIPTETINRIISEAQIIEVIGDFLDLTPRGKNFIGSCPFHDSKSHTFSVVPGKNIYKCFGCGKGGNVISFLMEFKKWTYPQTLNYLAEKYNIKLSNSDVPVDESISNQLDWQKTIKILEVLVSKYSTEIGEMIENDKIFNKLEVISTLKFVTEHLKIYELQSNSEKEINFSQKGIYNKLSDKAINQLKLKINELGVQKNDNLSDTIRNVRVYYPRAFEPWSETEKELLRQAIKYTNDIDLLAICFQRGRGSIEYSIQNLISDT